MIQAVENNSDRIYPAIAQACHHLNLDQPRDAQAQLALLPKLRKHRIDLELAGIHLPTKPILIDWLDELIVSRHGDLYTVLNSFKGTQYCVEWAEQNWACNCPAGSLGQTCKHVLAVEKIAPEPPEKPEPKVIHLDTYRQTEVNESEVTTPIPSGDLTAEQSAAMAQILALCRNPKKNERNRLLYVGVTRASHRLVVCG